MLEFFYHDFFYKYLANRRIKILGWSKEIEIIPMEYLALGYFFAKINRPEGFIILNLEHLKNRYIIGEKYVY